MDPPALVPQVYVSCLDASLSFYVDLLGFHVAYDRPEERFACLALGSAQLVIEEAPVLARAAAEPLRRSSWSSADLARPFGRGLSLEIRVAGLEAIGVRLERARYAMLLGVHMRVRRGQGEDHAVRQLLVGDPDGHLIRLWEPIELG